MRKINIEDFSDDILKNYKRIGVDAVELAISDSKTLSVQTRNVKLENIESSSGVGISLNVIIGKKQATLKANNLDGINAVDFLDKGKFMAESSLEDPFAGLPDKEEYAKNIHLLLRLSNYRF